MRLMCVILLAMVCMAACKKEDQPILPPGTLSVSSNSIRLSANAGSTDTLVIRTNSAWSVSAEPAGVVSLSRTEGRGDAKVGITVIQENTSVLPRTVNLRVNAGGLSENIAITQQAALQNPSAPLTDFLFGGSGTEAIMQSILTSDSGMLHVGYTNSNDGQFQTKGGRDVLVLRTDKEGKLVWLKTFGSFQDDEAFSCVRSGDNYFIGGSVGGSGGDFSAGTSPDAFLIKINDKGDVLFNKRIVSPVNRDGIYKVILSSDNRVLVAGGQVDAFRSDPDFWFAVFNQEGDLLLSRHYGWPADDYAIDIVEARDKSIYMAGTIRANNNDMVLMKLSAGGDSLWSRTISGSGVDEGIALVITQDDGVVMAGNSDSRDLAVSAVPVGANGWLFRFSAQGEELWRNQVGGIGDDYLWNLYPMPDGKIIGCGMTRSSFPGVVTGLSEYGWIFQADAVTGMVDWHGRVGGDGEDAAFSVIPFRNGFYLSGYSASRNFPMMANRGQSDAWLSFYNR